MDLQASSDSDKSVTDNTSSTIDESESQISDVSVASTIDFEDKELEDLEQQVIEEESQCGNEDPVMVDEEDDGALPHLIMLLAIVFVSMLGLFQLVIIGSSVHQKRNQEDITRLPFHDLLAPETVIAMKDPTSPPAKAWFWIKSDPSVMEYSLERSLQRFHLAVLYYALGGPKWQSNSFWLDPRSHECTWFNQAAANDGDTNPFGQPVCEGDILRRLDLSHNGLAGSIPFELGQLTSLSFVDLSGNPLLSGEMPARVCAEQAILQLDIIADCSTIRCCF